MKLFGVRDIGSNVLKNTSETSLWDDLSCERPVGHKLHVKKSCGRANRIHTEFFSKKTGFSSKP
jgi:hypothetical protein